MHRVRSVFAIPAALVLLISIFPGPSYGSGPIAEPQRTPSSAQADVPELSDAQKSRLIELAGERIAQVYAFPEEVPDILTYLENQLTSGAYDEITEGNQFAEALTGDLRGFTEDLHFAVRFDPPRFDMIDRMGQGPNPVLRRFEDDDEIAELEPDSPQYEMMFERFSRTNFNLRHVENLDGNVGYLKLGTMPPLDLARPTVDAAMQFLAYSDAVVIDVRGVPGGVGGFIPYLMSYFFPVGNKLLYTREFAWAGEDVEYRTVDEPGAPRLDHQPVYVLVDAMTGSAAENLAYTLQQHGRATVVGEATAGAAHSSSIAQLMDGFVLQLPVARVVHPVSGSNWDQTGVQPDIETGSSMAMDRAYEAALENLLGSADGAARPALQGALDRLHAGRDTVETTGPDAGLDEYAGMYGTRSIHVRDGGIRYQRQGGPQVRLARIEGDLFQFDLDPNMRPAVPLPRIRFDRSESGQIVSISAINDDGTVREVFEKTN